MTAVAEKEATQEIGAGENKIECTRDHLLMKNEMLHPIRRIKTISKPSYPNHLGIKSKYYLIQAN